MIYDSDTFHLKISCLRLCNHHHLFNAAHTEKQSSNVARPIWTTCPYGKIPTRKLINYISKNLQITFNRSTGEKFVLKHLRSWTRGTHWKHPRGLPFRISRVTFFSGIQANLLSWFQLKCSKLGAKDTEYFKHQKFFI